MCLSDVYFVENGEKKLLMKSAASVKAEGDNLTFTNILGIPTEFRGTIEKIDLLDNTILIRKEG